MDSVHKRRRPGCALLIAALLLGILAGCAQPAQGGSPGGAVSAQDTPAVGGTDSHPPDETSDGQQTADDELGDGQGDGSQSAAGPAAGGGTAAPSDLRPEGGGEQPGASGEQPEQEPEPSGGEAEQENSAGQAGQQPPDSGSAPGGGSGRTDAPEQPGTEGGAVADVTEVADVDLESEAASLAQAPAAISVAVTAVASGTLVQQNEYAVIDYSNTKDGYVMVCHTAQTSTRLKAQVVGPTTTYTYNLTAQKWAAFPLSDGNGEYRITVYKNVEGTKYAAVVSLTTQVALTDEFAPFLHSNQYVDFDAAPNTVAKAAELTRGLDTLGKVAAVYEYVVKGLSYDQELAASVQSGYLPVLDTVLAKQSGICFDYAALMTGMLRSQSVPCKLVVGYAGTAYHAWISVWTAETGWIDGAIFFDGTSWQRLDPTFASSSDGSEDIMAFIGDGTNYSAKYFY